MGTKPYFIGRFMQDEAKSRKRRAAISAEISALLFRVTCNEVSSLLVQENWIVRCQELDSTELAVSFVLIWWIFISHSEFLSHLEKFTAILKYKKLDNYRKCKHFHRLKNFAPLQICTFQKSTSPSKNVPNRMICVFLEMKLFLIKFEVLNFYIRVEICRFNFTINILFGAFFEILANMFTRLSVLDSS